MSGRFRAHDERLRAGVSQRLAQRSVLSLTPRLYAFSGVRPSSGAETGEWRWRAENSSAFDNAELAATEDGRTPLNRYPRFSGVSATQPRLLTASAVFRLRVPVRSRESKPLKQLDQSRRRTITPLKRGVNEIRHLSENFVVAPTLQRFNASTLQPSHEYSLLQLSLNYRSFATS